MRAYEELENQLEIDQSHQAKIFGLRSQLARELSKKTNNKKSGQALSDNYKSNWIYWDSLQFLVPMMQEGKRKDNLPDIHLTKMRVQKWKTMKLLSVLRNLQEHPMKWQSGALNRAKLNSYQLVYRFLKNLQMPKKGLLNATFRSMYLKS